MASVDDPRMLEYWTYLDAVDIDITNECSIVRHQLLVIPASLSHDISKPHTPKPVLQDAVLQASTQGHDDCIHQVIP